MTGDPHPPNTMLQLVACIPAYNEERTRGGVVVRDMKYVDQVVVCDDGSGDLTDAIAGGLGAVLDPYARFGRIIFKRVDLRSSMWVSWRSMWR